jgi:UDP-galactose transporter B1
MVCNVESQPTNNISATIVVSSHEFAAKQQPEDVIQYAEIVLEDGLVSKDYITKTEPAVVVEIIDDCTVTPSETNGKKQIWLLLYCFLGIMVSFTLNGLVLEKMTSHRVLGELSLTFVFCLFYSGVALFLRWYNNEKPSTVPQNKLCIVGLLAFGSTISSMVALRYVTFITRILGKSCKSIPVMIVGLFLGKSYKLKKYLSVFLLSIGVAIFLIGTAHEKHTHAAQSNETRAHQHESQKTNGHETNLLVGFSLLVLSLLFDGATGALEDRFLEKYHIGAFDLMYIVNIWKSLFAFIGMMFNDELITFMEQVVPCLPNLLLLSGTGALGQAFIFFTISKFGALTTSIIGTCRKVLSIVLSVILFGHILSLKQFVGLGIAFVGISFNWIRFEKCFKRKQHAHSDSEDEPEEEAVELLDATEEAPLNSSEEQEDQFLTVEKTKERIQDPELLRGLELVRRWDHTVHHHPPPISTMNVAHAV